MKYKLERYVDGAWYVWGTYSSVENLVSAAVSLGFIGFSADKIRTVAV